MKLLKNLLKINGNKKSAAIKLNCSIRTINRLINKYISEGKAAFIHMTASYEYVTIKI